MFVFKKSDVEYFEKNFNKDAENELENLRKNFVIKFTKNNIQDLSLDDYVVGKQNELSFCNYIETKLKDLGDIHGSTAIKFGIYYGKKGNDQSKQYRFAKKYGKNLDESFYNIKSEIIKLIESSEQNNIDNIKSSKLAPIFRGKILSTYHPEKYLNIFSEDHLNYFLTKLNIKNTINLEILEKQEKLLMIKNNNKILKNWSNFKFSCFLYQIFGKPSNNQETIEKIEDLVLKEEVNKENFKNFEVKSIYEGAKDRQEPIINNGGVVYPRNKKNAVKALIKANFKCEFDESHPSFIRKNGKNYTEPHHLIPMQYQKDFQKSLDVPENIVSLCSNCHNQIHYGRDAKILIKLLYEQRKEELKNAEIYVELKDLLNMYKS